MRDQGLMRGMSVVFANLIVSGRFPVIFSGLRVVHRSRSMVLGCTVILGHDVSSADSFAAYIGKLSFLIPSGEPRKLLSPSASWQPAPQARFESPRRGPAHYTVYSVSPRAGQAFPA